MLMDVGITPCLHHVQPCYPDKPNQINVPFITLRAQYIYKYSGSFKARYCYVNICWIRLIVGDVCLRHNSIIRLEISVPNGSGMVFID